MAQEPPPGARVTYNQQFRRCRAPSCPSCAPGRPGHGPYWYAYWREDGRLRSLYLGKEGPGAPGMAEGPATAEPVSGAREDAGGRVAPGARAGRIARGAPGGGLKPTASRRGHDALPGLKAGVSRIVPGAGMAVEGAVPGVAMAAGGASAGAGMAAGGAACGVGTVAGRAAAGVGTESEGARPGGDAAQSLERSQSRAGRRRAPSGSPAAPQQSHTPATAVAPVAAMRPQSQVQPRSQVRPHASALRVQSLGAFRVWRGAEPIPDAAWSRRKAAALFKCLLAAPGHRLARDQAIDLLWPDAAPGVAANNLKVVAHHLRRILDDPAAPGSHVRVEGESIILAPHPAGGAGPGWWDAAAFAAAAASALAGRDPVACLAALALYLGEYLPEDRYEEWATATRQAMQEQRLALLSHLAALRVERGEPEDAIAPLQQILAADPCLEDAARTLMRLHAAAARFTEATRVYRRLVQALERELGLGPDAQTRALHQRILAERAARAAGTQAAQPAPASPDPRTHPLAAEAAPLVAPRPAPGAPVQPSLALEGATTRGTRPPLVGRAAELAALLGRLAGASQGRDTGLALLRGAAGIGKSRLVAEFIRGAFQHGALVLLGRGYQQEGDLPYGPILEALRPYIAAQRPSLLAEQCGPIHGGALLGVLPELATALPGLALPAALEREAERHRLFAALAALLHAVARDARPAVLVIEDLHWADATTIQALHYLHRTCGQAPLLILGVYRPEETDAAGPLAVLARDLARESPDRMLDLRPLDTLGTRSLISALLGDGAGAAPLVADEVHGLVWGRSRGNPFFAAELLEALRTAGTLVQHDGRWLLRSAPGSNVQVLTANIRALIGGRVERLDPAAAQLLRLCAVLGKDIRYDVLHTLSDLGEERLLAALELSLEAGLLTAQADATGAGDDHLAAGGALAYAFAHPLIPEALYQGIPPARRALLHGRVGAALETMYGARAVEHAADLAWHFGQGGQHERAAHYAALAGDRAAAALATPEAIAQYTAALAHRRALVSGPAVPAGLLPAPGYAPIDGAPPRTERSAPSGTPDPLPHGSATISAARLEERLGDLCMLIGEYDAAQRHFARARLDAGGVDAGAAARRADLARKEGMTWERRGEFDRALAAFDAAVAELAQIAVPLRADGRAIVLAAIELSRGEIHHRLGAYGAAESAARQALTMLRRASAPGDARARTIALARADALLGSVALDQGDHDRAMVCFRRSLAAQEAGGDQQGIAASWRHLGDVAYDRRDYPRAAESYRAGLAVAERIGDPSGIAAAWNGLAIVARERGATEEAEDGFRRALAIRERIGDQQGIAAALGNLGAISQLRGSHDEAEDCYRRSLAIAERIGDVEGAAIAWYNLARVAGERGDPAAGALARRARLLARTGGFPAVEARAILEAARARLHQGRVRHAAALLQRTRSLAADHHLARTGIAADLLAADLALTGGDHPAARAAAGQALERATAQGLRLEAAQAHALLGRCPPPNAAAQLQGSGTAPGGTRALPAGANTPASTSEVHLRQALAEFEAIGATAEAARIRESLSAIP